MALVAERWGLIPELRAFKGAGKPVWGTCAGLIFLADRATGTYLLVRRKQTLNRPLLATACMFRLFVVFILLN